MISGYKIISSGSHLRDVENEAYALSDVLHSRQKKIDEIKQDNHVFWYNFIHQPINRKIYFFLLDILTCILLCSCVLTFLILPSILGDSLGGLVFVLSLAICILSLVLAAGFYLLKCYSYERVYKKYVSLVGHAITMVKISIGWDIAEISIKIKMAEREIKRCRRKVDKSLKAIGKIDEDENIADETLNRKLDKIKEEFFIIKRSLQENYKKIEKIEKQLILLKSNN